MTSAQRDYVERAGRDNPGWVVRTHPHATGSVIVEVGDESRGRWRVEGLVEIGPAGDVLRWSQR